MENNLILNNIKESVEKFKGEPSNPDVSNKLWKMFINNDGLMTICLKNLFDSGLRMELLGSNVIEINEFVNDIEEIAGCKFKSGLVVQRLIEFINEDSHLMYGLSYWDENVYNDIFQQDEGKPIGIILQQKEVEFYRLMKYYLVNNNVIRISTYKMKGQLAFILLEIMGIKPFEGFFGKL
jgi:hypothetical protein